MKRVDILSTLWFALAIAAVVLLGQRSADAKVAQPVQRATVSADAHYSAMPDGERALIDANGTLVPVRPYVRIATSSTVADGIALALLEPERIVAMTDYGRRHSGERHLYGERLAIVGPQQLETLLEHHVELLITNNLGSQADLARAREAGMQVFNLGDMRGLSTLIPNIAAVAALIGEPERGRYFTQRLLRQLRAVAADIAPERRRGAVYVSAYANQLFGGGSGTSYHDVLVAAGLRDVAAERYSGWVHYDPEQLLELDPELLLANVGTGEALCKVGGLENLRACREGKVITLDNDLLSDPGVRMLEAAELLRERVYGPVKRDRE